jgi:hypothetical protein
MIKKIILTMSMALLPLTNAFAIMAVSAPIGMICESCPDCLGGSTCRPDPNFKIIVGVSIFLVITLVVLAIAYIIKRKKNNK